jgi:hypothetical protein
MSDAFEQSKPTIPFPAEGALPMPAAEAADPLAGDWSEGLRGPVRALGIAEPRLLSLEGIPQLAPLPVVRLPEPAPVAPVSEVEAPDAWGAATEDPLQSAPPPASEPPSVIVTFSEPPTTPPPAFPETTPPSPSPAFLPDITPPSPAPAFQADVTPASPAPAFLAAPLPAFEPGVTPATPSPAFFPEAAAAEVTPATPAPAFVAVAPQLDVTPATPAPAFPAEAAPNAGVTPTTPAPAFHADAPSTGGAPTPWSEAVAAAGAAQLPGSPPAPASLWDQVTVASSVAAQHAGWEMQSPAPAATAPAAEEWSSPPPAAEPVDDTWSAPPPAAEPITEWKAEAPEGDWQEIKRPEAPAFEAPPAADWGTLSSGPDWSAPPAAAPADEAWGSAPPPPTENTWDAAPAPAIESSWEAPAPAASESEWSAPPPPPAGPMWSAPPVGASALQQMDSDPPDVEPVPGAAKDLFGPAGTSLSGDDDAPAELGAADEVGTAGELGPPEELASPEDVLKPVEPVDDDADLLVPVEEERRPRPLRSRPAQALGSMQPLSVGALDVQGEHRVAVHTRGGRTRRGTVKDVDLSKSQFQLTPQGGGAPEPIYHAEVKAIFFMLAPGEKLKPADGGKVRVTFADGRSIDGHRDGADAKHGFFLIPADAARTNTRRIYVAREATRDIKDG